MNDVLLTHQIFQKILNNKKILYNDLLETKEIILDTPVPGKVEIKEEFTQSIF
ncbi:hypothetical protein HC864_02690 [Candidatus Gracilibacteria bacterium]|nr:hypothetical protein [Candidatus Gracilibacteria bacterium]